ncbi:MAG: hypothetical protein LBG82_06855, partial [Clostridiales Family XIII bacterium]|nr:hypothetical protein [Clostridiales Family XIII bacterium]
MDICYKFFKKALVCFLVVCLSVPLFPVGVYADESEPAGDGTQAVEFYWWQYNTASVQGGFITGDQLEIYDENNVRQQTTVPITQFRSGQAAGSVRVAKFELSPGLYRWEGYQDPTNPRAINANYMPNCEYDEARASYHIGSGYFEVEDQTGDAPQVFMLGRGKLELNSTNIGIGASLDLYDYLGHELTPYRTSYRENDPNQGAVRAEYLLIMRNAGEQFDFADNPDDTGEAYMYIATSRDANIMADSRGLLFWTKEFFTGNLSADVNKEGGIYYSSPRQAYTPLGELGRLPAVTPGTLTVRVSKGASFDLYKKLLHFKSFINVSPQSIEPGGEGDEYDIYIYKITPVQQYHYEAGGGEFLREFQIIDIYPLNPNITLTVNLEKAGGNSYEAESYDDCNLLANVDDSGVVELTRGTTFDL